MMIALWGCLLATGADTKITVLSDIHVMSAEVYEIVTPSTAAYPCAYRQLTLNSDMTQLKVDTKYITSLKGVSDFQSMAKDRLVDGTTRLFMKEEADSEQGTYYNLQGIRVTAPSTKGLYIQNGRLKPVR